MLYELGSNRKILTFEKVLTKVEQKFKLLFILLFNFLLKVRIISND